MNVNHDKKNKVKMNNLNLVKDLWIISKEILKIKVKAILKL
jgi:hypothetical protein